MMKANKLDLHTFIQLARSNRRRLTALIVSTTLFAAIILFTMPLEYESIVLVQAKETSAAQGLSMQANAALSLLGGNVSSPVTNYMEMLKSRTVLEPVMAHFDLPYKEKMTYKSFAKDYLKIVNPKKTDLIELTAIGRSAEEAQEMAQMVMDSFQKDLTRLNQKEQSFMGKFLKERVALAQRDMEQAEIKMLKFQQQEKIYAPIEQAEAFLKQMLIYDQQIAQFQVQIENNQARLRAVQEQLGKQNAAIAKYQLADHPSIVTLRSRIIEKQMTLFTQEQLFTDKHPGVLRLKQEIDELNGKLRQEVNALIKAGTSTLNPVHAELLADKTKTEVGLYVSQASYDGLKKLQADNEASIKSLSDKGIAYVGLKREVRITSDVYAMLVRQHEENKIKEAMESMNIQIIDKADLPKRHERPKRAILLLLGGMMGVVFAAVYVIVLHKRQAFAR